MQDADKIQPATRFAHWLAPILALLWFSALLAGVALLLFCWSLVKSAWGLG